MSRDAWIGAVTRSREALPHARPPEDGAAEGGCGVIGFASTVPVAARHLLQSLEQMRNRGNGKGGGIAAVGLDPEQFGVDAGTLERNYLLMMADHLLDPDMNASMCRVELAAGEVVLAVDRKLDLIYDMDDATKVRLEGERIVEIGKEITDYNAIDTGLFACGAALVACLAEVRAQQGDASLTDGMRVLIERKKFRALDIGPSWWQDVDTPGALAHGAKLLQANMGGGVS